MMIVYCNEPIAPRQVDSMFAEEFTAACSSRLQTALIGFEALAAGRTTEAVRTVPAQPTPTEAVYRGWMLTPEHYGALYQALHDRGLQLINTPAMYRHAHYLPESYGVIEAHTAKSVWMPVGGAVNFEAVMALVAPFGDRPIVVKDYVKSQKHYWHEAFYIPSATDRAEVERVVRGFLELQGDTLNAGLVFREFVELAPLAQHQKSGMPLSREFRLFFLRGALMVCAPYWDAATDDVADVPLDRFVEVAAGVESNFFTMDVAQRTDGTWMIVELGDGQVAGLPDSIDAEAFYRALSEGSST